MKQRTTPEERRRAAKKLQQRIQNDDLPPKTVRLYRGLVRALRLAANRQESKGRVESRNKS